MRVPFSPMFTMLRIRVSVPIFIIGQGGRMLELCQCLFEFPLEEEDYSSTNTCGITISFCNDFEMVECLRTERRLTHRRPFPCPQSNILCWDKFITASKTGDGLGEIFEPKMSTSLPKRNKSNSWKCRCHFLYMIPVCKSFPVFFQFHVNTSSKDIDGKLSPVELKLVIEITQGLLISFEPPIHPTSPKIEMRMRGSKLDSVVESIKSLLIFFEVEMCPAQSVIGASRGVK